MGLQDNSGDIIFDVVLTDEGRRRLAKGDGTFNIVKFALGDDEINYALYDTNSATQLQDIEILQTPIFEAFTNNTSNMSSMLMSIPRNNLLYLPVIKINEKIDGNRTAFHANSVMHVAVDANTENNNDLSSGTTALAFDSDGKLRDGFILGFSTTRQSNYLRVDSGIDNSAVPPSTNISNLFLDETQYSIEIDNRLGTIVSKTGTTRLSPSSVDDDDIANYVVSTETDPDFVFTNVDTTNAATQVIEGARSTYLEFRIASTINLRQSDFLFNRLGTSVTSGASNLKGKDGNNQAYKYIDSLVKITGLNTGYSIDLPIRFVKL